MTTVTVTLNRLPEIAERLEREVPAVLTEGALAVVAAAAPITPVDTGLLRTNTTVEEASAGNPVAGVTWNQDYAAYRHEGTARMEGVPFAATALDQVAPQVIAKLRATVEG